MPRLAITSETCSWSRARMLTQNAPDSSMRGQAREVFAADPAALALLAAAAEQAGVKE